MRNHRDSDRMVEAAFTRLRDEICLRTGSPPAHAIVVSSARRGEGRTSVALGLARAFARAAPGSVALADFDLQQPSLHQALGMAANPGVSDVLRGEAGLDQALARTPDGLLSLLPAGSRPEDAGMLLASAAMGELMAGVRTRAKTVVLDAMPVESGIESQVVAAAADAVVLVVRADRTVEKDAAAAISRLRASGSRVVGVVLNASRDGAGATLAAPERFVGDATP